MIKGFAFFESNNFVFNNAVVQIVKKSKRASGEYEVIYLDENGKQQIYLADTAQEVDEDFIPTDQIYTAPKISKKKKRIKKAKDPFEKPKMCNLVYYIGKKKIETVERNIPEKLAHALKNSKYKNNATYRDGRFEIEEIIQPITEAEGMIKGYTDPNPENKKYNWSAVPKRDKKKLEGPNMYDVGEISIGDPDPVKKFKDWNGKFWEKKKKKKK